jgi:beta-glucosidase
MSRPRAFAQGTFTWLVGIEDTCVYPADALAAPLDEHELTGHTTHWRDDLALAASLGATAIRYGVSWPLVNPAPGVYDWSVLDEVIPVMTHEFGLTMVADLVHYGTPTWLANSFADVGYPQAIAEFAGALAARYRDSLSHFTPLNEPVTTASFCGLRGVWPPALTGWEGWVAVSVPMALGIALSAAAIRAANPDAVIVHVEASTLIVSDHAELDEHAALLRSIGWLPTDLVLGRVDPSHPMHAWLLSHGASRADLVWLAENPTVIDLMGVNYYPDLTPRRLVERNSQVAQVSHDQWSHGFITVMRAFADRYEIPLLVTETSIEGDDDLRTAWVKAAAESTTELIDTGLDIRGLTWWPLFDFVDWSWAAGGANVEEFIVEMVTSAGAVEAGATPPLGNPADGKTAFLRRMGLVRLEEKPDGSLERVMTPAAAAFAKFAGPR